MRRTGVQLVVIVEGQTEQAVCDQILKPHLCQHGVELFAQRVGKKGGTRSFSVLRDDVKRSAQSRRGCYITTLFDYYGLNSRWPDVKDIKKRETDGICSANLADAIQDAMLQDVTLKISSDILWAGHFIPYIQLHELEALLFAGPREMAEAFGNPAFEATFQRILAECRSCEDINDSPATAPSKRIGNIFPGYRKGKTDRAHAPRIMAHIGLERVRSACPRFDRWLATLESLSG